MGRGALVGLVALGALGLWALASSGSGASSPSSGSSTFSYQGFTVSLRPATDGQGMVTASWSYAYPGDPATVMSGSVTTDTALNAAEDARDGIDAVIQAGGVPA